MTGKGMIPAKPVSLELKRAYGDSKDWVLEVRNKRDELIDVHRHKDPRKLAKLAGDKFDVTWDHFEPKEG